MRILLAPMEGLLDAVLRDILTRTPGVDRCVSEFIRVTDTLLPERVFLRVMPELLNGGCTPSGVPVRGQLLGSDPACLADNAARLAALGSPGIDLNFGCPSRVVNRHGGGAALLEHPELLHRIVAAVRRAVPAPVPVSAKMRLGLHDDSRAEACAQAIAAGGADELVVHARTKAQAYRPPAWWERIADVAAAVHIPVVANGEIWTVQDALRCRALSGVDAVMLGRGMVADPGLALALRAATASPQPAALCAENGSDSPGLLTSLDWSAVLPLLLAFWQLVRLRLERRQQAGRLKQWLNFLRRRYPQAELAYQSARLMDDPQAVEHWLATLLIPLQTPPDAWP